VLRNNGDRPGADRALIAQRCHARRARAGALRNPLRRFIDTLWQLVAGYGHRPQRALAVLAALVVAVALLVMQPSARATMTAARPISTATVVQSPGPTTGHECGAGAVRCFDPSFMPSIPSSHSSTSVNGVLGIRAAHTDDLNVVVESFHYTWLGTFHSVRIVVHENRTGVKRLTNIALTGQRAGALRVLMPRTALPPTNKSYRVGTAGTGRPAGWPINPPTVTPACAPAAAEGSPPAASPRWPAPARTAAAR
jgi:hypothetical protein